MDKSNEGERLYYRTLTPTEIGQWRDAIKSLTQESLTKCVEGGFGTQGKTILDALGIKY